MEIFSIKSLIILPFLLLLIIQLVPPTSAATTPKTYANFIKKSCNATTYPSLCIKSLIPYAATVKTSPVRLCNAALTVAIQLTRNCSASVSKLTRRNDISRREAAAVKECIDDLKDAVYQLKQTTGAMGHLRDGDRELQWANAKTYASAAITDAETCVDGFLGRKANPVVKKKIRGYVSAVEMLISNALSLMNHLY